MTLAVSDEARERFREAIVSGDLEDLAALPAALLAGMQQLGERELAQLLDEGLVTQIEIPVEDGGSVFRPTENPRAKNLLKLLEMLGATAAQQSITPKSQGERKRDVSVSEHLDWMQRVAAEAQK